MRMRKFFVICIIAVFGFVTSAQAETLNTLEIVSAQQQTVTSFTPFTDGIAGSLALADLGSDGTAEIIVGAGFGMSPTVRVLRQDGSIIGDFLAYDQAFKGGVNVATCDLDGDGINDIITGAGFTGGPHVRVFNNLGKATGVNFFAYAQNFHGGVNVACGDVTGDSVPEIITGAGLSGGPHIKVFTNTGALLTETFLDMTNTSSGAYVSVANLDTDTPLEIIASTMTNSDAVAYSYLNNQLIVASTPPPASHPHLDSTETETSVTTSITANTKIFTLHAPSLLGDTALSKSIRVDLSEQRLVAYQHGIPVNSFLVSTGVRNHPTPLGTTTITDKIPIMDYRWYYGLGNPNNYNLKNVKWNLRFKPYYYIHSAYWHNNFGHVMSHGCVNTSLSDAEWIYNWATVGTTVTIAN
jgi:lipoprotein-anchoring transpeptidase ErfK/SrfK